MIGSLASLEMGSPKDWAALGQMLRARLQTVRTKQDAAAFCHAQGVPVDGVLVEGD